MSKNSTLRALFFAIQKGDAGAVSPLADCLIDLDADDLASPILAAIPEGGRAVVRKISAAFDACHHRSLLAWEVLVHRSRLPSGSWIASPAA
jgi:hypothetical protein